MNTMTTASGGGGSGKDPHDEGQQEGNETMPESLEHLHINR